MSTSPLRPTVTGAGDPVVVLANGLGTTQRSWRHVVAALRDACRMIRFDYPGMDGASLAEYRAERYLTLHAYADDVVALLDDMDVRDVTWVGHSVSGMIGLLAAAAAPDRIARVVTIASSPRYLDDAATGYAGGFSDDAVSGILEAVGTDYHAWAGGFSPLAIGSADQPEAIEEFAASLRRMRPDVARQTLQTIFRGDYRVALPLVAQPVTVVQTRADVAVPAAVGRYLVAALPNARYRELDAAGHVPQLTAPAELVVVLREVLHDVTSIAAPDRAA